MGTEIQVEDQAIQSLGAGMRKRVEEIQSIGKELLAKNDWRDVEVFDRKDPFENVVSVLDSMKHAVAQLRKHAEVLVKANDEMTKEKKALAEAGELLLQKYSRLLHKKQIDCPECDGTGKVVDGKTCEKCKGRGVLQVGGGMMGSEE